jgi:hypothetical protein
MSWTLVWEANEERNASSCFSSSSLTGIAEFVGKANGRVATRLPQIQLLEDCRELLQDLVVDGLVGAVLVGDDAQHWG